MQAKPSNRLDPNFSPPRDVSNSPAKRMFPERNLHNISHNVVLLPQDDERASLRGDDY